MHRIPEDCRAIESLARAEENPMSEVALPHRSKRCMRSEAHPGAAVLAGGRISSCGCGLTEKAAGPDRS